MRALSFARTMHHEATESVSVTTHGRRRESKESSAPGEGPEEVLSDGGSTPPISTKGPSKVSCLGLDLSNLLIFQRFPPFFLSIILEFPITFLAALERF